MAAATISCPTALTYLAGSATECDTCPWNLQMQVYDIEGECHLICRTGDE
uniref:Uncharacterized protein n=1 Tax=viral metagenome TaxID=1070528 RepID=A0A6M3LRU6_9ZZZZ